MFFSFLLNSTTKFEDYTLKFTDKKNQFMFRQKKMFFFYKYDFKPSTSENTYEKAAGESSHENETYDVSCDDAVIHKKFVSVAESSLHV